MSHATERVCNVNVDIKCFYSVNKDCPGCGFGENRQFECTFSCGYVYSNGYPLPYPKNTRDRWQINVPESHYIQLTFLEFDLNESGCDMDYLDVYDGDDHSRLV